MSYFLTDDQKLIVQSVDEFCKSSHTQQLVADCKAKQGFSRELWKAAAEQGYIGAIIPEEYGGMGYDMTTFFLIFEELFKNNFPLCGTMAGHFLATLTITEWANNDVKKKYLPQIASGDCLLCGTVTDPAGMANFPEWGLTETKTEKGWKINGTKVLTTNSDCADVKVVFAKPSEGKPLFDHVYLVEKGTPGLESGDQEHKLIPDCSEWGSIVFKDVEVPDENRIDDPGVGYYLFGPSFLFLSMMAMTMGYGEFKMALDFTTQRTRYGRPLIALQSVSHRIADMAIRNETSRCLIYTATRLWDEGRRLECYRLCCMAKAYVTESLSQSAHDAVVLFGGIGFTIPAMIGPMYAASIQFELAEMPGDVHRDFLMETYGIKSGWKNGQA